VQANATLSVLLGRNLGTILMPIHTLKAHFKIQFRDLILKRFRYVAANLLTLIGLIPRLTASRDHIRTLSSFSTGNIRSNSHRIMVVQTTAISNLLIFDSLNMLILIEIKDLLDDLGRNITNSLVIILNAVAAGPASLR
jgi:hypothetical protein